MPISDSQILRALRVAAVVAVLAVTLAACKEEFPPRAPTASDAASSPEVTPTPSPAFVPGTRFAQHVFVMAGDTRDVGGLGELLETIDMDGTGAAVVEGNTLTAIASGSTCFRYRYREDMNENEVQTLCAVVVEETGDCDGLPSATLDIERFLGPEDTPVGNADLLESGVRTFYAVCVAPDGGYRLQQPTQELPTLYYWQVDALGEGPYSTDAAEFGLHRGGVMPTFSGDVLPAPRVVTVSREVETLELVSGRAVVNENDCGLAPSCTFFPGAVEAGDFLRITYGPPLDLIDRLTRSEPEAVAAYYEGETGLAFEDLPSSDPNIRVIAVLRLVGADVMEEIIPHFDEVFDLRGKGARIIYNPSWPSQTIASYCLPGGSEHDACAAADAAIGEVEAAHVERLKAQGYELWFGYPINITQDEAFFSFDRYVRPHFSLFDGVVGWLAGGPAYPPEETARAMARSVRALAEEIGDMPVLLQGGGALEISARATEFCEADLCASDFRYGFEQPEAWMSAALDVFAQGQLEGFALGMFDGGHFDIREPYEEFELFALNRSGETGYNTPALNIYRAQ